MPSLYVAIQGAHIARESERLVVGLRHQKLSELAIRDVDQVVIFGNVSVTTPALGLCLSRQVDVVFLSLAGKFKGRLQGNPTKNIDLRHAQFATACSGLKAAAPAPPASMAAFDGGTPLPPAGAAKTACTQADPLLSLEIARAFVHGGQCSSRSNGIGKIGKLKR